MNYLVTGAAGFIGSALAKKLIAQGNNVTTIDNLFTGKQKNIPEECHFIKGDVSDQHVIEKLNNLKFDAIFHIAGQSSGEVSFENPLYDLHTNTQSTLLLLEYAKKTDCPKFIYASSMSVYGDANPPECKETTPTIPKSFYAVGKLASENYMRIYSSMGITCTSLRFFNVYGVGQNMDNLKQGMASIYLAMALRDHNIQVKGSKDRFRDFVYIDDVVDALIKSLTRTNGFDIYNVCTGIPTTVEKVVDTIADILPFEVSVEYLEGTPGDQFGVYGNKEKIEKAIDWHPSVPFHNGMEKMIEWAINNEQ